MQRSKGASEVDETLHAMNAANRSKGIKVSILRQGNALSLQASWKDPGEAKTKQRRLSLGLSADKRSDIREADRQVKAVWAAIKKGEDPRKAITSKKQDEQQLRGALLVRDAVENFEQNYIQERR